MATHESFCTIPYIHFPFYNVRYPTATFVVHSTPDSFRVIERIGTHSMNQTRRLITSDFPDDNPNEKIVVRCRESWISDVCGPYIFMAFASLSRTTSASSLSSTPINTGPATVVFFTLGNLFHGCHTCTLICLDLEVKLSCGGYLVAKPQIETISVKVRTRFSAGCRLRTPCMSSRKSVFL
jgi:hypothetical protein